jgi:predicted metal-dependent enzyme (double-stranded beta helix superfamily)
MTSFELERFIDDVKQARGETEAQRAVEDVLGRAVSEPRAILATLGEPKQAGIHPLLQSEDLTIIHVVWPPFMVLLPHEHAMWASIGVYTGREDNILWRRAGERVAASGATSLCERDVFGLPVDAVHSVTNPIPRFTGAIHVYGGDFFAKPRSEWDPETLRERPFDLEAAQRTFREASARARAAGPALA